MSRGLHAIVLFPILAACATSAPGGHGTVTTLSAASAPNAERCPHKVPKEVCTRCNPALVPKFQAAKDWCKEHGAPESQCFECHPDLTFDPLPPTPAGADLVEISAQGEDVPALEPHVVPGKVTLFDFYAVWCAPCRKIDEHLFPLLGRRGDLAVRKLNVVSWETPVAERYLRNAASLPYVVVYGKRGQRVAEIAGLDLDAIDRAIDKAGAQ